jgi:uncharacterized membrane protein
VFSVREIKKIGNVPEIGNTTILLNSGSRKLANTIKIGKCFILPVVSRPGYSKNKRKKMFKRNFVTNLALVYLGVKSFS